MAAASPFESIRSGEILPLFKKYFQIVRVQKLGGTLQHLLYNGIVHNFIRESERAEPYVKAIYEMEDTLMDFGVIPSDFALLIGRRRVGPGVPTVSDESPTSELQVECLIEQLRIREAELNSIRRSRGWRLLAKYGRIKHRFFLPLLGKLGLRREM